MGTGGVEGFTRPVRMGLHWIIPPGVEKNGGGGLCREREREGEKEREEKEKSFQKSIKK